jgi:hypothetical protein
VLPRATELQDPAVANVDQVLLVFAMERPPLDLQTATRRVCTLLLRCPIYWPLSRVLKILSCMLPGFYLTTGGETHSLPNPKIRCLFWNDNQRGSAALRMSHGLGLCIVTLDTRGPSQS